MPQGNNPSPIGYYQVVPIYPNPEPVTLKMQKLQEQDQQDKMSLQMNQTLQIPPSTLLPTFQHLDSLLPLLNSFKQCYFNSVFDPLLNTEWLMEGFTRSEDDKRILSQFLLRTFMDLNSIAPLFLQGTSYTNSTFRQGRLNLLLYPFMFSENISLQNKSVDKQLSNTIGYFTIKKLLSVMSATIPLTQEDVIRITPNIPFSNEILLNQTIEELLTKVNFDVGSITSKNLYASNYAESSGTYIGIKVPNSLEYTKLRTLGFAVLVKQQGVVFIYTYFLISSVFSLILPQDASLAIRLFFQNFAKIYRRYPLFFTRTQQLLEQVFDTAPYDGNARDPQYHQTFFASIEFHILYKLIYKKTRYTPFKFKLEQISRQRDLQNQTSRILVPYQRPQGNKQAIVNMEATFCVENADLHTILDGSKQFIDALSIKQQRQFVSDFLANQVPRLQEQERPV